MGLFCNYYTRNMYSNANSVWYCWWKKHCITWDVKNHIIWKMGYLPYQLVSRISSINSIKYFRSIWLSLLSSCFTMVFLTCHFAKTPSMNSWWSDKPENSASIRVVCSNIPIMIVMPHVPTSRPSKKIKPLVAYVFLAPDLKAIHMRNQKFKHETFYQHIPTTTKSWNPPTETLIVTMVVTTLDPSNL